MPWIPTEDLVRALTSEDDLENFRPLEVRQAELAGVVEIVAWLLVVPDGVFKVVRQFGLIHF